MNDATHSHVPGQSSERVNSPEYDAVVAAVADRLQSIGENPHIYDLDWLAMQFPTPGSVAELDQSAWFRLLTIGAVEDQTTVPCPRWCTYPARHPFESEDDDGRQVRYHAIRIETPRGVDLSLTQEEKRVRGEDGTFTRGPVEIWLTAENDHLDAAGALEISAALQRAAATLEEITTGGAL